MEKKFYVVPVTDVYIIKSGEFCDEGPGVTTSLANGTGALSKDGSWDTDWEDEEDDY